MLRLLKKFAKTVIPGGVYSAICRYRSTPHIVLNWHAYAMRQALRAWKILPCKVTSLSGCRFYLGSDPVDDWILHDVSEKLVDVYFPRSLHELREDFLLLEIGAHHGFVTVEYLRRYPKARIIAVEPNPGAVKHLMKNLVLNGMLDRVEILDAGIGKQDMPLGFLKFSKSGSWGDSIHECAPSGEGLQVTLLTLAQILKGRCPDVIKSNAEGAEYQLIPQLFDLGLRPRLIILMPHASHGSISSLENLINSNGYRIIDMGTGDSESPHWHCILL